jgi:uncharacterized protein (TIGR03083 family)
MTDRYFAELESSTAILAELVGTRDLAAPIPTCPDWTLRKLGTHVGRAHRWAALIVSTRSAEFIPFRSVPDGRFPDHQADAAAWLTAGAELVTGAVSQAGAEPVWAFGSQLPASFWARRMAHETLVHRADAQLAVGQPVQIAPEPAADAIDEWLDVMSGPVGGRPDPRAAALPVGATLHVHASGEFLSGPGEWLVRHGADGVTVRHEHAKADVAVTGPADRLLLMLLRRLPADDKSVTVHGDTGLLTRWLAGTQF